MSNNVNALEVCRADLFTDEKELRERYPSVLADKVLRVRTMYMWQIANPAAKDRQFVEECISRFGVSRPSAYDDLKIIKAILPGLASASRDFHRWRYIEMILETYKMARDRKDTKTMERAATSYGKLNKVDADDVQAVPFHLIVVQPFVATADPTVLGIKPIPGIDNKIQAMLDKYRRETIDIEDVEYEEADLEENILFAPYEDDNDTTDTDQANLL